jgi:hypothetical protein
MCEAIARLIRVRESAGCATRHVSKKCSSLYTVWVPWCGEVPDPMSLPPVVVILSFSSSVIESTARTRLGGSVSTGEAGP